MQIPLTQILISDRQRLEMDEQHILNLMESFKDVGQVQSVLVSSHEKNPQSPNNEKEYLIIAGATRCTAALRLGWTTIRADVVDDANATLGQRQKAEYVENALRRDLPWQDSCLAIARLNSILSNERAIAGEPWTQTMLGKFTGYSKVNMSYMLKVAELLRKEPRDEEIWRQTGFMPAFQIYLARLDTAAVAEIERRRQAQAPALPASSLEVEEETNTEDDTLFETEEQEQQSSVEFNDRTPPKQQAKNIKLYANCDGIERDGLSFSLIIVNKPEPGDENKEPHPNLETLYSCLTPGGFLVLIGIPQRDWGYWQDEVGCFGYISMSYPIIWNKQLLFPQVTWPFLPNHAFIMLLQRPFTSTAQRNPMGTFPSIIDSFPNVPNDTLPLAVINTLCSALATPSSPVYMPINASPVEVAMCGYTPVWDEPDATKLAAQKLALTKYYQQTFPGCEVIQ